MEDVLIRLAPAAVFGLLILVDVVTGVFTARGRIGEWRRVAKIVGLDELASSVRPHEARWRGQLGRWRVRLERARHDGHNFVTRLTIEGDSGLTLQPERAPTRGGEREGEREIELGDDAFDDEVSVRGDPERARALLDAETRTIVRRMLLGFVDLPGRGRVKLRPGISLVHGHLRVDYDEKESRPTVTELADAVSVLLALAERFRRPAEEAERLARAIEHEPQWRVRRYGLEVLSTSYPTYPATTAALRRALADDVPEVRLQAALALGEEGRQTLLEIALRRGDQDPPEQTWEANDLEDGTTARAINALGTHFPREACEPILLRALRWRRLQTAEACIQALGRLGGPEADPLLARVLSRESGPLAVAAAKALGEHGGRQAEAALVEALDRGVSDLTVPVIDALARIGTASAVPAIREAAEQPGSDVEVRRAARQAIAAIQVRLPGATPGQLSLAGAEAGQLSLADDDPRGRVSLPEGTVDEPRLSTRLPAVRLVRCRH